MKILRTFFALILLCFVNTNLLAQITADNPYKDVSISSPTAAALGKYADIPVNYHTGVPQISIPLYTVQEGSLSLPISLNYHASGLKVMELASWVGAGWSLDAGGVITRTVQGAPDEKKTRNGVNDNTEKGYFSDYGYLSYLTTTSGNQTVVDAARFANGIKDGEPDLFFFNFSGYSGKFYFNDDRKVVMVPEQDVKIEYDYTDGGVNSINGFIITIPNGTKYYFGRTASTIDIDPIEITNPATLETGRTSDRVISSWYLNKIESYDKKFEITFSYIGENYSYHTFSTFPILGTDNMSASHEYKLVKNIIQGVRLTEIDFDNNKIVFTGGDTRQDLGGGNGGQISGDISQEPANTEARSLGNIQITNGIGFCKRYNFAYSYFNDASSGLPVPYDVYTNVVSDRKRLKLTSLQELSCDGTASVPAYTFEYSTQFVPRRLSFAQDHWGFINDAVSNTQLIPTYYENNFTQIPGANRNPSWPAMEGGALKKVTYPTGGSTDYQFEANQMWLNYPTYTEFSRITGAVGYSGTETFTSPTYQLTDNPYKLTLSLTTNNAANTQYAVATVYKIQGGTNTEVKSITVNKDKMQNAVTFQKGAGDYFVTLNIHNKLTGDAASTTLFEKVPGTYSGDAIVGGLRIAKITTHDGIRSANDIVQNFNYNNPADNHSTGIVYSKPTYVEVYRNAVVDKIGIATENSSATEYVCSPNGCLSCDASSFRLYYKSPGSLRPMQSTQGSHIGYNEVRVSQTGNGYTIYRYWGSNLWDVKRDALYDNNVEIGDQCDATLPSYPYAPLPPEYKRGDLKEVWQYNEAGSLLKETFYQSEYAYNTATTPAMIMVSSPETVSTQYEMQTYHKTYSKTIEKLHNSNGLVTNMTETFYESNFHNQPTRTTSTLANGDVLETKMKYTADFRLSSCDATSTCVDTWNANSASLLTTLNGTLASCGNMGCKWAAYQNYEAYLANERKNYIECRKTNYMNTNSTFNTCIESAKQNAGTSLKPILEMQQKGLNPVIETTSWKNGQLIDAGYNNYAYSTETANSTIVYIDKTQNLNLAAPASSFTLATVDGSGQNITKNTSYQDETSVTFNTGNISKIIGKDGVTKSFIWDYRHTLPTAQIINASPDQAAYTSFETYEFGNWTFLPVAVAASDALTGKKVFQLGGTNGNISKTGLIVNNTYIISYWSKNSNAYSISNVTNIKTPVSGTKSGAWTCFTHYVTATATSIEISGSGFIDELRLHPQYALMESYTYTPLLGISSKNDNGNRINYFEYDPLGRLKIVRDANKFILSRYCYNYAGQAVNCDSKAFYSEEVRQTFTRNNCSPAPGGTYEYIVPAGKYSSDVSQQAANVQATNERDAYGQAAANQNAPCLIDVPVDYITYAGSGISGYHVKFTNTDNRSLEYEFTVSGTATSGSLGTIPSGVYDINIFKPNSTLVYNFWVQPCGFGTENSSSAQIYHVNITTACKTINFQKADQ